MPRIKDRLGKLNPPPAGKLPILIGGSGPKVTLKLVAQYADMWHSFGDADDYQRKNAILLEHCANEGRDPAEIERTWGVDDVEAAEALAEVGRAARDRRDRRRRRRLRPERAAGAREVAGRAQRLTPAGDFDYERSGAG